MTWVVVRVPAGPPGQAIDKSGFAEAIAAAKAAQLAVVFVGSDQTTEAENFDRDSISLTGVQEQLVQAVLAVQPRTVVGEHLSRALGQLVW